MLRHSLQESRRNLGDIFDGSKEKDGQEMEVEQKEYFTENQDN